MHPLVHQELLCLICNETIDLFFSSCFSISYCSPTVAHRWFVVILRSDGRARADQAVGTKRPSAPTRSCRTRSIGTTHFSGNLHASRHGKRLDADARCFVRRPNAGRFARASNGRRRPFRLSRARPDAAFAIAHSQTPSRSSARRWSKSDGDEMRRAGSRIVQRRGSVPPERSTLQNAEAGVHATRKTPRHSAQCVMETPWKADSRDPGPRRFDRTGALPGVLPVRRAECREDCARGRIVERVPFRMPLNRERE